MMYLTRPSAAEAYGLHYFDHDPRYLKGSTGGSGTPSCETGYHYWNGFCQNKRNPCSTSQTYCGSTPSTPQYFQDGWDGACFDPSTCNSDQQGGVLTCKKFIKMNKVPGKCYAVCIAGMSDKSIDLYKTKLKCTTEEKVELKQVRNIAKREYSLNAGATAEISFCVGVAAAAATIIAAVV